MNIRARQCGGCGMEVVPMQAELCDKGPHYAVLRCPLCDRHMGFMPKPQDDPTKYKRPNQHRDLVAKYSNGVCELCLLKVHQLPPRDTLHAHHVDPYHAGGESTRENIWILCTACHRLVEFQRRYHGMAISSIREERIQQP